MPWPARGIRLGLSIGNKDEFFLRMGEINGTGRPTLGTSVNDRVVCPLMTGEILK